LKHYDDGRLDILTRGQNRFVINDMYDQRPYLEGRVSFFDDEPEENNESCQALADKGLNLLKEFAPFESMQEEYGFVSKLDFKAISFLIAGCEGFSYDEKQKFLEMSSTYERLKKSVESLEKIIHRTKITSEIRKIIGGNGNMARFSSNLSDIVEPE
jgi:Lon protease-like protein